MIRSQRSIRVLWSGSGLMRNTKHGQRQKALVFYTLKGSREVGKALSQNISTKILLEKNETAAQVPWPITAIPSEGLCGKLPTAICSSRFSTLS